MAELKEMQAKIRLGLVPAPPPKVKKGNLMRVLGDGKTKTHSCLYFHLLISVQLPSKIPLLLKHA
jgi:hypothetical protein